MKNTECYSQRIVGGYPRSGESIKGQIVGLCHIGKKHQSFHTLQRNYFKNRKGKKIKRQMRVEVDDRSRPLSAPDIL